MKEFNYKIMNEAQIAEVNELWKDHGDAIAAYGLECVNADKSGRVAGAILGGAIGALIAGLGCLGGKGYRKWKSKKETCKDNTHNFVMV